MRAAPPSVPGPRASPAATDQDALNRWQLRGQRAVSLGATRALARGRSHHRCVSRPRRPGASRCAARACRPCAPVVSVTPMKNEEKTVRIVLTAVGALRRLAAAGGAGVLNYSIASGDTERSVPICKLELPEARPKARENRLPIRAGVLDGGTCQATYAARAGPQFAARDERRARHQSAWRVVQRRSARTAVQAGPSKARTSLSTPTTRIA